MNPHSLLASGLMLWLGSASAATPPPAPGPGAGQSPEARAAALFATAAAATGGAAWDKVKEMHLTLKRQVGGDEADADVIFDPRQGVAAFTISDGPNAGRIGFDGKFVWSADMDGAAHLLKDSERADALADLTWRGGFWLRPIRAPLSAIWVREEGTGSHATDIVRVANGDAAPLDVAFDRANHLPVRAVIHRASGDTLVRLSQWRRTDGTSLPWRIDIEPGKDKPHVVETVTAAVGASAGDPKHFAEPTAPVVDYVFRGDAQSVAMPIRVRNGHIYVDVTIGLGPKEKDPKPAKGADPKATVEKKQPTPHFAMIFDTTSGSALDQAAAAKLGLTTYPAAAGGEPMVRIPELRVGGVTLKHQTLPVRDFSKVVTSEGGPVDGVLGTELARRFTIEIDYEGHRLVLLKPDGFEPPPSATAIPLLSVGRVPAIAGRIDGVLSTLIFDTGSAAGLAVGQDYARAHGFIEKWHASPTYVGLDAGVQTAGLVGRAASLELGVYGVAQPVAWITDQVGFVGGDASLGNEFLRRYDVILDFRHDKLWLQPNHSADLPDDLDRSGLAIGNDGDTLTVAGLLPQSPAEHAGLHVGDRIEMVGGDRPGTIGLSEIRGRLMGPAGTSITMGVRRNGDYSSYRIVLADPWNWVPAR